MDRSEGSYSVPAVVFNTHRPLPVHLSLEPFLALRDQRAQIEALHVVSSELSQSAAMSPKRKVSRTKKKPGRRLSKENQVLRKFFRDSELRRNQPPKLENIRYRMMRSLKKLIRRLHSCKPLKPHGLLQFPFANTSSAYWQKQLEDYISIHSEAILRFADVQNGPKVDQSRPGTDANFRTYSNSYLESVFRKHEVRIVYQLFVRLVFAEESPQSLSERFRVLCCRSNVHSATCISKWTDFRKMLESYMGTKVAAAEEETLPESLSHH